MELRVIPHPLGSFRSAPLVRSPQPEPAERIIRVWYERLRKRVKRWRARLYCADGWAAYAELPSPGQPNVGKDGTHGIERAHARQRQWLVRFRRRSIIVAGSVRLIGAGIALVAGNNRISYSAGPTS